MNGFDFLDNSFDSSVPLNNNFDNSVPLGNNFDSSVPLNNNFTNSAPAFYPDNSIGRVVLDETAPRPKRTQPDEEEIEALKRADMLRRMFAYLNQA